ncbi:ANTAR domain-containing response regulator [Verminephrobacter aporrectodeae]|uniref:ANTAR domain-containing protein n=1 Tax=Verminephrobacter aporrectodeae subsp. tuberculatae TaxID=1110392 RepID=A0ABT3KW97_9BURK|nr:ANTAR domain-containing protein [Verminephrobacter aporrectodeae]MCW5221942.1 ANTAR domain-containing protein [Verminephrobacter aporrectodeae subsp. tuberculatae]MCW5258266.1 ANTAR domain-containing protein [Verminephrobacter aporrectodeae subsp. tuberculatae]MCW5291233.1 ANTAR domain-containing protein [Verminephrobacter aporrectodeae subsp. tuberculatae]MCW5322603.1 ANTAR domain-containing protein [Verminephrobacter aporrectodeae subsp. tuberculatae]MCW8166110.1 ANTAR domain-containing p
MNTATRRLFDDLRMLRVTVVHPPGDDRCILEAQLRRIGCPVRAIWPLPAELPGDCDVVFFLVGPELRGCASWSAADTEATLIALSDYENPTALKLLLDTQAHGVITKPYRSTGVLNTLVLARACSGYQQRLQNKIGKLEEALKARRTIEKAIRILMQAQGLSDNEAYEHMRSRATSLRIAVGEVATMVIHAHETMDKLGLGKSGSSTCA